jgi:hypothetical protein
MKKSLWQYVNWMLNEGADEPEGDLLTEPDLPDEEEEEQAEQSVSSAIAGATTPLGTDATYPNAQAGRRKSPAEAAGDAFGGARPPKKMRK